MKPILSLEMMLGHAAAPLGSLRASSPSDDLEHRLVQILWANGEGLDTAVPTRGTALLQHGFKEWSGARGVTTVRPCAGQPGAPRADTPALLQALGTCEEANWTPLVLCRAVEDTMPALARLRADGPCALLALGAPLGLRLAPRAADLASTLFPVRLPWGVDPASCLWLGAPPGLPAPALNLRAGLRVDGRDLRAQTVAQHLDHAEVRLRALAPASLWCLLFLDDIDLGAAGGPDAGLQPEVLAATLRWLQRQVPWVVVFVVSHERVTQAQRSRLADLARHLGSALYRHHGVAREAFPAPRGAAQ